MSIYDQKRRDAILAMIDRYTAEKTVDRKTAREALIAEGIYTKKGKLRVAFGGPSRSRKLQGQT